MNFYLKSGYVDIGRIMNLPYPFIFILGGRGTGKTYGVCDWLLQHPEEKFIYLRRQQNEADAIANPDFSPFQPVINDHADYKPITLDAIPGVKNIKGVYHAELTENGTLKADGDAIGYIGALATISGIRGFSGEHITVAVLDEFIPEKSARNNIKNEGDAFLNCYETINRNREIKGRPPLKFISLTNANKLASPIFVALGITDQVDRMSRQGKESCFLDDRGIALIKLRNSPISEKKKNTALYRAAASEDFRRMAIENDFDTTTYLYVHPEPLEEYRIVAQYEDLYIYRHKALARYYVCRHCSGHPKRKYQAEEFSQKRLKREQAPLFDAWLRGNISFQDYYCKMSLTEAL